MKPTRRYSIAEARDKLTAVIREVEKIAPVELTRRGEPVAVIISIDEYRRLAAPAETFSAAYERFRPKIGGEDLDLGPELFSDIRDLDPGREPEL
ncbi:MAG: type II toxin-antitoxin system Phd/YefM family antitoxin [Anaerolineae bacterium]|nr:type II toxin-antitoxin system Phd/YefM family antitoxin [Anaerolineae bacterium]